MGFGHISVFMEFVEGVLGTLTDMSLTKCKLYIICCIITYFCAAVAPKLTKIAYALD